MKVKNKLWVYSLIVTIGLILFYTYRFIGTRAWGLEYPWNSFLFPEQARFSDFFQINELVVKLNPYSHGSSYPPLALLIARFFAMFIPGTGTVGPDDPIALQIFRDQSVIGRGAILSLYGIVLLVITFLFWKRLFSMNHDKKVVTNSTDSVFVILRSYLSQYSLYVIVGLSVFFSAPMIYALDRGNYLILCVLFLVLFCSYYEKNNYVAAVFLAIAACLKIYPVVFFLVFFLTKKWKPLAVGLFTGAFVTAASMAFFGEEYIRNFGRMIRNIFAFSNGIAENHSYYYHFAVGFRNLIGTPVLAIKKEIPQGLSMTSLTLGVSALFLIVVLVLCVIDKRPWRQIIYLSFFMILFPTPSFYYNLSYLIAPVFLFLYKENKEKLDMFYLISLALLMTPKSYFYFEVNYLDGPNFVGLESFINPLIMCTMLCVSLVEVLYMKAVAKRSFVSSVQVKGVMK